MTLKKESGVREHGFLRSNSLLSLSTWGINLTMISNLKMLFD
jgi:hypothetical protein